MSQTPGAIGYVDVYYAVHNHLGLMAMKNKSGKFVLPKAKGIKAAAQLDTQPAKDGSLSIVNPPKSKKYKNAYPISTYTYVDVQKSRAGMRPTSRRCSTGRSRRGRATGRRSFSCRSRKPVVTFDKKQIKKIHS